MGLLKLPKMNDSEIDKLLSEQFLCRIAFAGDDSQYIAPFQYALVNSKLYFHFTNYGRKMSYLKEGKPVCVEVEKYKQDLSEYAFVVLTGKLTLVSDPEERKLAIDQLVSSSKQKNLSRNFLAVHGFPETADWASLKSAENLVIAKLEKVTEKVGLKSP
ncbi:MAG: pyridoxamine 5'-phosphate oxidase family protein [Candidatus Bathyarchaeota archaeon]|nr:pyridoxamine 5'-phosphate oxidase family protein [Candidatus Bathyarchaeota archaeon]